MSVSAADALARAGLHRLFWRVHFWAGLVTAPLVLFAACTGLLYVFTPEIEARLHTDLDAVPAGAAARPLDAQFAAATAAFPALAPRYIIPANADGETTQVMFAAPAMAHAGAGAASHMQHAPGLPQGRIVYVDPGSAKVVGSLAEMARFRNWARKLHSSALQGDAWRWPIELAASWMLVMLATGITMWWPRSVAAGGPGWRALIPRLGHGRASWREWHASLGFLTSALLVVLLITGLTWSRQAGDNFRAAQQALGQNSPNPTKGLRSVAPADVPRASLQQLLEVARIERAAAGPGTPPLQLTLPKGADGLWRVDTLARDDPTQRLTLMLDPATAQVLYRSGWRELPLLAKATAVGIPFHRAEFGAWNQALIAAAALAVNFATVSGFVMWWKRRPARQIGAPTVSARQLRVLPSWLWALTLALAFVMPVFGTSLIVFIGIELALALWRRYRPLSTMA